MQGAAYKSTPWDGGVEYPVELGASFEAEPAEVFHTIKYDFKPQSIDYKQPGDVQVEANNRVNVQLHSTEDKTYTFTGKANSAKDTECVLIFDEERKVFTLERLTNAIILKQLRTESGAKNKTKGTSTMRKGLQSSMNQLKKSAKRKGNTSRPPSSDNDTNASKKPKRSELDSGQADDVTSVSDDDDAPINLSSKGSAVEADAAPVSVPASAPASIPASVPTESNVQQSDSSSGSSSDSNESSSSDEGSAMS